MSDVKQIAIQDNILCKRNVVRIREGTKITNGIDTGEPCVVIEVVSKEVKDTLEDYDIIPDTLSDSKTKTDVVVGDIVYALARCPDNNGQPPTGNCAQHNDTTTNCLQGGTVIGPQNFNWVGTFGGIARDNTDELLIGLSNAHVTGLCFDPTGYDWQVNPLGYQVWPGQCEAPLLGENGHNGALIVQGTGTRIPAGLVKRTVPLKFNSPNVSFTANYVDAAIFTLDASPVTTILPSPVPIDSKPLGYAANTLPLFDFNDLGDVTPQNICVKIGRTTGRTAMEGDTEYVQGLDGIITDKSAAITVSYNSCASPNPPDAAWYAPFINLIEISLSGCPTGSGSNYVFSNSGDSGSMCYIWSTSRCRWEVLGLVFAGSHPEDSCDWKTYVCRMDYIFKELNIGENWTNDPSYELGDGSTISQNVIANYTTVLPDVSASTGPWDGSIILSQNQFTYHGPQSPPTYLSMSIGPSGYLDPSQDYHRGNTGLTYKLATTGLSPSGISFYEDVPGLAHHTGDDPYPTYPGNQKNVYHINWTSNTHLGNIYTINDIPAPEISLPRNIPITFILHTDVQTGGLHPFQIIDSTSLGVIDGPWNNSMPTFTIPATGQWGYPVNNRIKYQCTTHGTSMGNDIFLESCANTVYGP